MADSKRKQVSDSDAAVFVKDPVDGHRVLRRARWDVSCVNPHTVPVVDLASRFPRSLSLLQLLVELVAEFGNLDVDGVLVFQN